MFLVAGWLLACYVSGPAVWLSGRGPLGDWANSLLPAWGGVRVVPRPTFLRARLSGVGGWVVVSMSTRGPCGACGLANAWIGRAASVHL